jgi:hypothetical protein
MLEATMRVTLVMLAALAGIGLSTVDEAFADARNLSCISDGTILERRVIRDCGKDGQPIVEPAPEVTPPPPPPILLMHDGGRKAGDGSNHGREKQGGGSSGGAGGGTAGAAAN